MSEAMMTLNTRAAERRIIEIALIAAKRSIRSTARWAEKDLERVTQSAVGGKLHKAWNSRVYPDRGLAKEPTAYIFPKGGARTRGAIKFFATRGTVRAKGKYMWIPLPSALRRSRRPVFTPRAWELANGAKLRPLFRPGKPPLLVLDARDKGSGAPSGTRGIVPIFIGLKAVAHSKRFSIQPTLYGARVRLGANFTKEVKALENGI